MFDALLCHIQLISLARDVLSVSFPPVRLCTPPAPPVFNFTPNPRRFIGKLSSLVCVCVCAEEAE